MLKRDIFKTFSMPGSFSVYGVKMLPKPVGRRIDRVLPVCQGIPQSLPVAGS